MKNAFLRHGQRCVSMLIFAGLAATGLFAAEASAVTVTLPHAVTVGNTILPSGQYSISSLGLANGEDFFVLRSAHGQTITIQAQKMAAKEDLATQVVFTKDGDVWHLDKMFIEGEESGYQFLTK